MRSKIGKKKIENNKYLKQNFKKYIDTLYIWCYIVFVGKFKLRL